MSHFMILMIMKRKLRVMIFDNDAVFEISAITLTYSYIPEMIFIVAYKKASIFICVCYLFLLRRYLQS